MYDLDGFKGYNDAFGHPAGDVLLTRLAASLGKVAAPYGAAYRLGGDEFCVLGSVPVGDEDAFLESTVRALSEDGHGFAITSSIGSVFLPEEALDPREALRVADQRLYVHKRRHAGRSTQHEMLLQALYEREPDLREHVGDVVDSASAVGQALGLRGEALEELRLAGRVPAHRHPAR
jgi:diguanylate cyclase (GGDEF)-like protein